MTSTQTTCGEKCEIYSRVTGYHRPISNWNAGKQEEFENRKTVKFKLTFENDEPVIHGTTYPYQPN